LRAQALDPAVEGAALRRRFAMAQDQERPRRRAALLKAAAILLAQSWPLCARKAATRLRMPISRASAEPESRVPSPESRVPSPESPIPALPRARAPQRFFLPRPAASRSASALSVFSHEKAVCDLPSAPLIS
jgi:hypothetical protein